MWTKLKGWLRRPRWSLRSFLVVCLLLAALSGWFARKCHLARRSPIPLLGPVAWQSIESPGDDDIVRSLRAAGRVDSDFRAVGILSHRSASRVDPPRLIPWLGPARLHHESLWCIVLGADGWLPRVEVALLEYSYLRPLLLD